MSTTTTTLISEEAGYRLEQAMMPDGKMVELKVPVLATAPSLEVAQAALAETDYDHSIVGTSYGMMAGSFAQRLYSLREAEDFMQKPEGVIDPLQVQHETIGFVDLNVLAHWIEETLCDPDLAAGIREITAQEKVYGKAMPFVKSLLRERIAAYEQVIREQDEPAEQDASAQPADKTAEADDAVTEEAALADD